MTLTGVELQEYRELSKRCLTDKGNRRRNVSDEDWARLTELQAQLESDGVSDADSPDDLPEGWQPGDPAPKGMRVVYVSMGDRYVPRLVREPVAERVENGTEGV